MTTSRECTECRHDLDRASFGHRGDTVTPDLTEAATRHLSLCSECRNYADEIDWLATKTHTPLAVPTTEMEERVRRAVLELDATEPPALWNRSIPAWKAASAAALLFIIGLVAGNHQPDQRNFEEGRPATVIRLPDATKRFTTNRSTTTQASIERHDYDGRFLANREVSVRLDD